MTETIIARIHDLLGKKGRIIVAVDGRCASGKTTLAEKIRLILLMETDCSLFHMDDFFLRPEQRTEERYAQPGGNVDRERFEKEVLRPLLKNAPNEPFSYRPFNCRAMAFKEPVNAMPSAVNIVEGSYSCHPLLWKYYDLHIFLTTSREEQMSRIIQRNGAGDANAASVVDFRAKWIPLEESYFASYHIEDRCELKFET